MPGTVALKNKTKRTKILNLDHRTACVVGECHCSESEFRSHSLDPKTGDVGVRVTTRQIPGSVHLLPGQWSRPLPESVLRVPDVAAMVSRRECEVETVTESASESEADA